VTTVQFPKKRVEELGPGTVGLLCGEFSRYSNFTLAMLYLQVPDGSRPCMDPGIDLVRQCNNFVKHVKATDGDFLWITGDDHVFDPQIVMNLAAHGKDVIVPNVKQRSSPFYPVVYSGLDDNGVQYKLKFDLPEHGVHQVFAAGSAGMLIRRHVLEALPEKPFSRAEAHLNEDLSFCKLVREAGFTIWIDVDEKMAHMGTMIVWPEYSQKWGWGASLDIGPPDASGEIPSIPIFHASPGSPAVMAGEYTLAPSEEPKPPLMRYEEGKVPEPLAD